MLLASGNTVVRRDIFFSAWLCLKNRVEVVRDSGASVKYGIEKEEQIL